MSIILIQKNTLIFGMSFSLEDSFRDFLFKTRKHNLIYYAIKLEDFICEKYNAKGLAREQICQIPLKDLWSIIQDYKPNHRHHFWIKS